MANEHQTGVTRFELYGLLSSAYAFILFVHISAGFSESSGSEILGLLAVVYRLFLTVALAALSLLFTFFFLRERKCQAKKEVKALTR